MNSNKGFSLIELILVLGLSSLTFIGALSVEKRRTETLRAEAVGQQFEEIGKALTVYITRQQAQLSSNIPQGTSSPNLPITLLQGVDFGVYVGRQYLPTTYNPINALGTGYKIQIRNNTGNILTGLVTSDAAIVDQSGSVRYDWLGYAARKAGSQSGMSFFTGAQITGLNAGWVIPNSDFNIITVAGQLAYRSQFQGGVDDIYLRRDGLYPMSGNIDMANHNIKDATDINFIGFLNGNNALLNNLQTGYILNNGNFQNNGNMQNNGNLNVLGLGTFNSLNVTNLATVGKVQLSDVVTSGVACSSTGLISRDATGSILSCQGGSWKPQGSKISPIEIYAQSPSNLYLSGCYSPVTYITVPQPGYYVIEVAASAYRYWGSYVTLAAIFFNPEGGAVCAGGDGIPAGTAATYFQPKGTCIQHLNAGSAYFYTIGSDASSCSTSDLYMMFNTNAKIRLLQAD